MSSRLRVTDPTELGLDPSRLHRIDQLLADRYISSGRLPGYSLLISRGGKIGHISHHGEARPSSGLEMADDTLVRIFSMTKPITSVALLSLYEEGRLKLNDPVSTYVPSWADLRVWADGNLSSYTTKYPEREMTIRDLLTHTSGLTYGFIRNHPLDALYRRLGLDTGSYKLESYVEMLAELPLLFSPGTQWAYSVATDVVGRLVEIISGQSLDAFLAERIFEPLAMSDTGFWVDDATGDRLAANYAVPSLSQFELPEDATGDTKVIIDQGDATSGYRSPPTFLSGGGGLVSTLADYHRFSQMLLRGGELDGARVLGRKTVEYATSNHLPDGRDQVSMGRSSYSETPQAGVGFGLGFSVVIDPAAAQVTCSPGLYGWGGAASTEFFIDPVEGLSVIFLTQLMPSDAYPVRSELRAMVYGALTT